MAIPLFRLHLVAFRCISYLPNPHPHLLPEGEGIYRGRDARFPSSRESLMLALRPTLQPATDGGGEPWPHLALFGPVYSYGRGWNEATLALVGFVRSSQERRNF